MNNKKNVWLLPTDKPSRLWINNLLQGKLELSKEVLVGSNTAQSICITDDSEIKEGDWLLSKEEIVHNNFGWNYGDKKVILTTDPKLIADGVQSINDEFLQWFCSKNGKVDFVKVTPVYDKLYVPIEQLVQYESQPKIMQFEHSSNINECSYYKIIIPKEEPKQHLDYINNNIEEFEGKLKEFKQEQKQYLIDIMRGDEELGLYNELYMSNKQITAVQEAIDLIKQDYEANGRLRLAFVLQTLNKAKEKEKQQIIDAWLSAWKDSMINPLEDKQLKYKKMIEEQLKKIYDVLTDNIEMFGLDEVERFVTMMDKIKDLQHHKDTTVGLYVIDFNPKELIKRFVDSQSDATRLVVEDVENLVEDWVKFIDDKNIGKSPFFRI